MTFERSYDQQKPVFAGHYKEAFVWIWLPGETEPVVAGKLETDNHNILFNYGKSYLERMADTKPAVSIYEPELPLKAGVLPLLEGLSMPGCIRDAAPDAWGRRVIINRKFELRKGMGVKSLSLTRLYLVMSNFDKHRERRHICYAPFEGESHHCIHNIFSAI